MYITHVKSIDRFTFYLLYLPDPAPTNVPGRTAAYISDRGARDRAQLHLLRWRRLGGVLCQLLLPATPTVVLARPLRVLHRGRGKGKGKGGRR